MSDAPIAVYGDWDGLAEPLRLGRLYTHRNAVREVFEYEFDDEVLKRPGMTGLKLMTDGARTDGDLQELWSRIVFNLLVSNADDHLRNHAKTTMLWTLSWRDQ
jgi:hypothetical protein